MESRQSPIRRLKSFCSSTQLTCRPSRLPNGEDEIEKFLRQNGGHLAQPVSIFWLSSTGLWSPSQPQPSNDGNTLAACLDQKSELRAIWRGQNNRDAAPSSYLNFLPLKALGTIAAVERQKPGRKLLLWIGPGSGTGSGANFLADPQHFFDAIVWFSTLLREPRIALYSLSVGETELHPLLYSDPLSSWETGPVPPPYQGYLKGVEAARQANRIHLDRKVLAVQSGGRVLDPSNDLASQINRCVADASAWYTLSFDPHSADHPDEYHDLRVLVGKPGLTARTNTGYYDQPYYYDQPNLGTKRVTVEQLGQVLGAAHGLPGRCSCSIPRVTLWPSQSS
jgi:hypothetical protein